MNTPALLRSALHARAPLTARQPRPAQSALRCAAAAWPASARRLPLSLYLWPLLACAALASMPTPARAQSDSAITVYGRMNLGLVHYGGRESINREQSLSSRFGVKGTENLSNGYSAQFVIETGVSSDTGDGTLGSRETSVGLLGPFGKLRLGYMLSPLDDLHPIAGPGYVTNITNDNLNGFWANGYSNLFTGGTVGSTACNQIAGPNGNTNSFAFDNRIGNSLRYDSPDFSGVKFATQYAFGEAAGCHAWASSNKLQYTQGNLNAALAYQVHHNVRGSGLQDAIWMLAVGYQITPANYVAGYYQTLQYANPGLQDLKQDGFALTWRTNLTSANLLELGWYRAGAGRGQQTPVFSGVFVGNGTASDLFIIGARHTFSKRTELWAQLAQLRNGQRAGYDLGGAGRAGAAGTIGAKPHALAFGIKHDF